MERPTVTKHCEKCQCETLHEFCLFDCTRYEAWWWQCTVCNTKRDYKQESN